MLNKLILFLAILFFLNACQTHLQVISQMEGAENKACLNDAEQLQLADIDYLLYANRMVDAMIQDRTVQKELELNRMKLLIWPISHKNNTAQVDMYSGPRKLDNRLRYKS